VEQYLHSAYIFMVWHLIKHKIVYLAWYLVQHMDNFTLFTDDVYTQTKQVMDGMKSCCVIGAIALHISILRLYHTATNVNLEK